MSGNFYIDFIYFIIYSVIGWMCEVVYCSIPEKKFINRGFLNGPLCPIYGFGALIVIIFLTPVKDNIIAVFFLGMLFTSVLEYVTSFGMEKLFHSKWWDYSHYKFNIHGRVCLLNSILFGIMCVVLMMLIHVEVVKIVAMVSYTWIQAIAITFIIVLTADTTVTVQTVVNINEKLAKLKEATSEFKEMLGDKIEDSQELIEKKLQENASLKLFEKRVLAAFPNMRSVKFQYQLEQVRDHISKMKKKIKERK